MGRGKHLTQSEAMFILALAEQGDDVAKICEATKQSPTAVRKVIANGGDQNRKENEADHRNLRQK